MTQELSACSPERIGHRLFLAWESHDVIEIRIGHPCEGTAIQGLAAFEALTELCAGFVWALMAGEICVARDEESSFRIRAMNREISLCICPEELERALGSLNATRPPR